MSDPFDPDTLQQLRTLLEHLEHWQLAFDPPAAAALRRLLLTRIRALETAQRLASETTALNQQRTSA